jgi:hypothetical protein
VIDCEEYLSNILDVAAGHAQPSEALRSHLEKCSDCQQLFTEAERFHRAVAALPADEPSLRVAESILAEARTRLGSDRFAFRRSRRWLAIGTAASAVLIIAVVSVLTSSTKGDLDPAAVAALESQLDQGLDRVRNEMDTLWPQSGWKSKQPRDLSSRIYGFQARLERFRSRTQQETFPLDFSPEKDDRQREGRGPWTLFKARYVS